MRGWPLLLCLAFAGCVAPGAETLAPASLGLLEGLAAAIPDASAQRLPNGDLVLTLVGKIAGTEEHELEIPEGVTYIEASITSEDGPVSAILMNAETRGSRCIPQTWTSWSGRTKSDMRCTAIAAVDPATKWLLVVGGPSGGSSPTGMLPFSPVSTTNVVSPYAYELTLTFSTLPLDGPSASLNLDALSRPTFKAMEIEKLEVPASTDGAGLHVEITRPVTSEKVPVMLRASPYNGPSQNGAGRAAGAFVDQWVARGYAVAIMDLRATGKSDGCFSMRGEIDQIDIADVVEHLGAKDWSNGKVGMHGVSYEGFTPAAAAIQQPPHLAAIFVGAPAIDTWSNYLPGGVNTGRSVSTVASYTTGNAALTPSDELPPDAVLHTVDAFCEPTIFAKGNDPRHLYDAWYAERNVTASVAKIQVPVLFEQGFWDNNVKANNIPDFFNALTVEKRAFFGSWQHTYALRADEQLRTLAWFDQWLKGIDTGILDTPNVEVLTNTREWRAADSWPSPDTTMVDFALDDGEVPLYPPALQPNIGFDFASVTTSEPLTEKLYLTGVPLIDMTVAIRNGGNAQLEARLFEETADGDRIFAGVGWINAAHRNGHDTFAPLTPGESAAIQMKLLPQDHVFQVGSKVVVEIRAVTNKWGGPEAGLSTPGLVTITGATLHVPTLPYSVLSPQPRSAS